MGGKGGVEERLGGARGGGAWRVGRAATDVWSVIKYVCVASLVSATSLQFLRFCLRVGTEKKDCKPFLHFSRAFRRLTLLLPLSLSSISVKGRLWRASHKEEEEEGRQGAQEGAGLVQVVWRNE